MLRRSWLGLRVLGVAAAFVLAAAPARAASFTVHTVMSGLNEVPANASPATGEADITVNGTITDWKVKSADDGAVYTLKVMRPNGPVSLVPATNTNFTAITSVQAPSPVPNGTFAGTPTGVIFDYPASLPIS
jgi:hypothetical protein